MAQRKRVKRPVPTRVEPERAWNGVFGARPASKAGAEVRSNGDARAPKADGRAASYEAVNGAYRVIDEYLRQGQRFAEQVWLPAGSAAPAEQVGKLLERFVRSAGDMGSAWLEMMGQWSSPSERASEAPRGGAGPFSAGRSARDGAHPVEPPVGESAAKRLVVSVEASRAFEVSVDVTGTIEPGDIEVGPLVSKDGKSTARRPARIDAEASDRLAIRIRVPKGHPPGAYEAPLLDRRTKQRRGTVNLTLS
jgi:hypothetical protein